MPGQARPQAGQVSRTRRMVWDKRYEGKTIPVPTDRVCCPVCNRLFFLGVLGTGAVIEIKCPKCSHLIVIKTIGS